MKDGELWHQETFSLKHMQHHHNTYAVKVITKIRKFWICKTTKIITIHMQEFIQWSIDDKNTQLLVGILHKTPSINITYIRPSFAP